MTTASMTPVDHAYPALREALAMDPGSIIREIAASDLRGMGGAGFPTGRKWDMVRSAPGDEKYVVANADEGEPGSFKDRYLLETRPHRVIEGSLIAAHAVGARGVFIYIRHEYDRAFRTLKKILRDTPPHGYGKNGTPRIVLWKAAGGYICGEESALIESIMGNRAEPALRPPYPAESGLFGKPTLVNNVETLANAPAIIERGSGWYRANRSKLFCVSGDVRKRGVFEEKPGVTLRSLVFDRAGGMRSAAGFKMAIVGGVSGRVYTERELDTKLEHGVFGNGAVIVLDETRSAMDTALNIAEFFTEECCGKCAPCRQGTVKFEALLEDLGAGGNRKKNLARLRLLSRVMKDTSLCGLGQTATNVFDDLMEKFDGAL